MKRAVAGLPTSVELRLGGDILFRRDAKEGRPPASVQKLILTMALFDFFGPNKSIDTRLAARRISNGTVKGSLWVLGRGDPSISSSERSNRSDYPTRLGRFVKEIRREGIARIEGSIAAAKNYFSRDWDARGWRDNYQEVEVALPTALTFNGNKRKGDPITNPERRLAAKLTRRLRRAGIEVTSGPRAGTPPNDLGVISRVKSAPLWVLARALNKPSLNFYAEVLGKRLGAKSFGTPGSIKKGARALERFARKNDARIRAFDSSGLSFANRVSPRSVVKMLQYTRSQRGWPALRRGLPKGGEGTLVERLHGVPLRAKTGSLIGVSTLAGWVWLDKADAWAEFAIMSRGISWDRAHAMEDRIVRIANARARP